MFRWTFGSYAASLGTVSSPALRKPKKAEQHAAHSMIASWVGGTNSQLVCILHRMSGDILCKHVPQGPFQLCNVLPLSGYTPIGAGEVEMDVALLSLCVNGALLRDIT